jgi:hypothetical protein
MSQQIDVMERLLKFYSKRYSGSELESKMNSAIQDLIDTNDINLAAAMSFLTQNEIEPKLKRYSPPSSSSYDPCGGGGGYSRSHC